MPGGEKFSVYGRLKAQSGKRDELATRLRDAMQACDGRGLEFGCVNSVPDDPDTVWITQVWTSRSAHDSVTRSEPLVSITAALMPLVAGTPEGCYGDVAYLHDGRPGLPTGALG